MTEWDDQIIILRLGIFHEADLWLRVLSRCQGLLTLFAFGGAKSRRRFCGCLDIFNTLQSRIKGSRQGYLSLQEASLRQAPVNLRSDWRKMGLAANCLRFAEVMRIDPDSAPRSFALLEDLRAYLERPQAPSRLTSFFFRLNLASLMGFAPDFGHCAICGSAQAPFFLFLPGEGRIFCPSCARDLEAGQKRHGINMPARVLARLSLVGETLPSAWGEDGLEESEKRLCARAIDCFIRYHIGIAWENGAFRLI